MINQQFPTQTWQQADFLISTEPAKFNAAVIHRYLSEESYWSPGVNLKETYLTKGKPLLYEGDKMREAHHACTERSEVLNENGC